MEVTAIRGWLCAFFLALSPVVFSAPLYLFDGQSATHSPPPSSLVSLGWNSSPSTNVSGYYLCWGLASGACTNHLDVGNLTSATVGGLAPKVTYYFTVVAYDYRGDMAPPSNEVSYAAPASPPPATPAVLTVALQGSGSAANILQLSFEGKAGATYQLQATDDFQNWETIWTTNCLADGPLAATVTDLASHPQRFFRVVQ
jgi:hypothetical protein